MRVHKCELIITKKERGFGLEQGDLRKVFLPTGSLRRLVKQAARLR